MFALSCAVDFTLASSFGVFLVFQIRRKLSEQIRRAALSERTRKLQGQLNRSIIFHVSRFEVLIGTELRIRCFKNNDKFSKINRILSTYFVIHNLVGIHKNFRLGQPVSCMESKDELMSGL